MSNKTTVIGFPRIGEQRELKRALENYWENKIPQQKLLEIAKNLRKKHLLLQKESKIKIISINDFSFYDNMLDTAIMCNAIPQRFNYIDNTLDRYFAMARGTKDAVAMEMTKWFNTNYHYIVPELDDSIDFKLNPNKIIEEYKEATSYGIKPKINIIGPITFLGLSKTNGMKRDYTYFNKILDIYKELVTIISSLDSEIIIQFEEPLFATDPTNEELNLLQTTYTTLSAISKNVKIVVATYFEHSIEANKILSKTDIWGIALDFVYGYKNIESLEYIKDKTLFAGVVNGRNIWKNNYKNSLQLLNQISEVIPKDKIYISSSCSLLHVPYSTDNESNSEIKEWLAFAKEKLVEIEQLADLFNKTTLSDNDNKILENNNNLFINRNKSSLITNIEVSKKLKSITNLNREAKFNERFELQNKILNLPILPTTTIGSFPQTKELRKIRLDFKKNLISEEDYENYIKQYIDNAIKIQEEIGLDVLVHGEPERNDMVEYFGKMLDGFFFTNNGWVQSYGSRCVKPPIIYGDISRPNPMTVKWINYAQSKTEKIVKGMLTGPVTILNWSFVREDIPRSEVAQQIALALRDEISDLQNNNIKIIQVDEAAFKEGYPLRKDNIKDYETWAVNSFKLAVSVAKKKTQIHTHMCYSEFDNIIHTIEAMDADVITIETARSGNRLLQIFKTTNYKNQIGPGVYDIHSPRIPSKDEFKKQIKERLKVLDRDKMWVNPDCGLKTRNWDEVIDSLQNMVNATKDLR